MKDIAEIDKNLKVETSMEREGLIFRNALQTPFRLYGITHDGERFRRVPDDVARKTNTGVHSLACHTAGGRLRFVTDSPYVAIKVVLPHHTRFSHMALTGVAGFDMYVYENGRYNIKKTFVPPYSFEDSYDGVFDFGGETAERDITLNFPLYNDVKELYIGLKEGSVLRAAPEYTHPSPIVFYGSSITQGGCASRPGTCYPAIISRRYDADHINLGFSGSARGERAMAEYIASLDMSLFVLDYDHNAASNAQYEESHEPFFKTVRAAHPDIPIVIMTRPKHKSLLQPFEYGRLDTARKTYENALRDGDKNVYFIPGYELMDDAFDEGCVDLCHPTDYGFFSMAKRLSALLDEIIK